MKIVAVSGYFDPLHIGHIELFEKAKELGHFLVVIVNNESQSLLKHGKVFMPIKERIGIIRALKPVDMVIESVDKDRTCCETLKLLHPHIFANGGDRSSGEVPEKAICDAFGIEMVDGLGDKIQASSWLLRTYDEYKNEYKKE